jgi:hypothetical protein
MRTAHQIASVSVAPTNLLGKDERGSSFVSMKMMKADEDSAAALMEIWGSLPAAIQGAVLDIANVLQAVARENADTVAKLEAQVDGQQDEIETMAAKCVKLDDTIGALGDRYQALDQETSSLREMNGALIAERSAFQAMEAAFARYAGLKHQVDALLLVGGADAHQAVASCAEPSEAMEASDGIDASGPLGEDAKVQSADQTAPAWTAGGAAPVSASGETGASTTRPESEACGRSVSGSSHIPS